MVGYYVYTTYRVQDMFQNAIFNEYMMWETLFTYLSTKERTPPPTNTTSLHWDKCDIVILRRAVGTSLKNPSVIFLRPLTSFYFSLVILKWYRYWAKSQKSWVPILHVPFISCVTWVRPFFSLAFTFPICKHREVRIMVPFISKGCCNELLHWEAYNKRSVFVHSSGGCKSKSKELTGLCSLGSPWRRTLPCLFQFLATPGIP